MLDRPRPDPYLRTSPLIGPRARPPARPRRDREVWLAAVILLVVLLGLALAGDSLIPKQPAISRSAARTVALVAPRPEDVKVLLTNTPLAIAPDDALAINAARPLDLSRLISARPFRLPLGAAQPAGPTAALDCLTKAVYYEAAVESDVGQRAVAQVVLNRMRSPIFPHTVCGVVFQGSELRTGCQFSFTCDGSLNRQPSLAGWMRARRVALAALSGHVEPSVGLATHYHANYVVPYWASSLDKTANIGAHIFYSMRGALGRSAAFTTPYNPQAEAPPLPPLTVDPIADLTTVDGTGAGDPLTGGKPRDRTVVQEDALGTLAPLTDVLPAQKAPLRADETKGGIIADENQGVLNRN